MCGRVAVFLYAALPTFGRMQLHVVGYSGIEGNSTAT